MNILVSLLPPGVEYIVQRFFPILAVLSFLLYPNTTIAGGPDQGNGTAIDPQTGEVYPITSGRLAVTPEWVYPFLGFTILKPPSIDPPRSPPYKPKKQMSKYRFSQAHTQTIDGDNSASVSSRGKSTNSGNRERGIVIYGSDGTQSVVQPNQAKKTFEDGTVVYGLDNQKLRLKTSFQQIDLAIFPHLLELVGGCPSGLQLHTYLSKGLFRKTERRSQYV